MSDSVLSLIKPENILNKALNEDKITKIIVNEILKISHLTNPNEIELIKFTANLIENLVIKKDNLNKQQMFRNILTLSFPSITTEQMQNSILILESLLSSKMIKKIPLFKYAIHLSKEFFGVFLKNVVNI